MAENTYPAIELHLSIIGKITATEIATTLLSFEEEYSRFMVSYALENYGARLAANELNLYVSECKIESIFARFMPAVETIKKRIEQYEPIKAITKFFDSATENINKLATLAETHEHNSFEMSKAQTKTFENLLREAPRMAQQGLILREIEVSEKGLLKKTTRKASFDANTAQLALSAAREHQDWISTRTVQRADDVIMYIEQAGKGKAKHSGRTIDRGLIPQISTDNLPIYFPSEMDGQKIKQSLVTGENNPFSVGFRVDVSIEMDQFGAPKSYTVTRVHQVIRQNDPSPGLLS